MALEAARFIIAYSNEKGYGVSNLKLQKLLYLVQAYFLVAKARPCFLDTVEAWDFGPVVPCVYREFQRFGTCDILRAEPPARVFTQEEQTMLREVVDYFKGYTATDLVTLTTNQTPWEAAHGPDGNKVITAKAIRAYFS